MDGHALAQVRKSVTASGNFLITDNKVSLVSCSKRRIALLARAGAEFALISVVGVFPTLQMKTSCGFYS